MRFFVLAMNDECRIVRAGLQAPLAEVNKMAFGVPYGVRFIGTEIRLPVAIAMARDAGFKEAIVNGEKQSIELVGVAGAA
ncbi:MAG: hypothetical protein ACLGXA_25275 [Acidobacteriota bacterium]